MPIFGQKGTGILGDYSTGGGTGMGGLLGGLQQQQQPEWANKLGLFSSALKDASAAFSGQQDPGALATWNKSQQQSQIRQQLLQGFSSQDPSQRQQAYTAAAMLGIPTDGIQKQQANSQLPAFLSSMKPQAEVGQVTAPEVSAQLPPVNGVPNNLSAPAMSANYDTGNTIPGKSFSDAFSAAGPELQNQYAGKFIDQAMKGPNETPHEGMNPATGKLGQYVLDNGVPKWLDVGVLPKAPTSRHFRQGTQDITQEFNPNTGAWNQVATGAAFKPDDPADTGGGLNDAAKINAAVRYNLNGTMPSFGMGKAARQDRLEVLNYAADLAKGIKPEQLVANVANFKANSASLNQQTKQFNSIEQNANTAKNSINLALSSAKAGGAGPTDSPVFNRWVQAGRVAVDGDPQVKSLQNHLSAFAEDYAKVMTANTSASGATDRAATEAHSRLNSAYSIDSLQKISDEMLKEMGGRHYAARAQIGAIQKQLGGAQYSEPQGVKTAQPDTSALPKLDTKTIGGQVFVKKNGQWYHQ